jgi:bifunctional non-homologous end joining protein LigD
MHEILQNGGVEHYCKTSGATGLHIAIPLGANYTYEQSRQFAEIIAFITHRILPKTTSLERSPKKRQKKVYLDFLQNKRGQTIAAPYCVRPIPKAPVSTPLEWREVNEGLNPKEFTMQTAPERFRKTGDLWKGVLGPGIDLRAALNRLSQAGIP